MSYNIEFNPVETAQKRLAEAQAKQADAERAKQAKIEAERKLERDILEARIAVKDAELAAAKATYEQAKRQSEESAAQTLIDAKVLIETLRQLAPQVLGLLTGQCDQLQQSYTRYQHSVDAQINAARQVEASLLYRTNPAEFTRDDSQAAANFVFSIGGDFPAAINPSQAIAVAIGSMSEPKLQAVLTGIGAAYTGHILVPSKDIDYELERSRADAANYARNVRKPYSYAGQALPSTKLHT